METPVSSAAVGQTPNMLSAIPDLSIQPMDSTLASPPATPTATQVEVGLNFNCPSKNNLFVMKHTVRWPLFIIGICVTVLMPILPLRRLF